MYTNSVTKLSIFALIALCLLATGSRAALVHYWTLDDPNLGDDGLGYSVYPPHAAQLVDPHASYTPPTPCDGKLRGAYDLGNSPTVFSDICIGGFGEADNTIMDGTLPPAPITVSFWFYPHYLPGQRGNWFLLANDYRVNDRFFVQLYTPDVAGAPSGVMWSIGATKDYGLTVTPVVPYIVTANAWHHVLMSVQRTGSSTATVTYSLNGGPARTGTALTNDPPVFDRGNKRLGTIGSKLETGKTFHGKIDDAAVWNEILPMPTTGFNSAAFIWNGGAGRPANVATGKVAYDPTPADKGLASNVAQLKWYNAQRLTASMTNDVYISTNRADLVDPCNVPLFPIGNKVATAVPGTAGVQSTLAVSLASDTIYYWRVATKTTNPADGNNVNGYAGPVCSFTNMANTVPTADAGPDRYTYVGAGTITLSGTVTDDGRPLGATVTCTWKDSGGTPIATTVVPSGNTYTCTATATVGDLDSITTYTLEGNDTTGAGSDTLNVLVKSTPCVAAKADPDYVNLKNASDINDDCFVNFKDFALTVNKWKVCTALDADCD